MHPAPALPDILRHSPVEVIFGSGAAARLGELARKHGARQRVLVVSDTPILNTPPARSAIRSLSAAQLEFEIFDHAEPNPTTETVADALATAGKSPIDVIIGLGGGSAMDCAKGVNLLHSNGGEVADYRGDPDLAKLRLRKPLLPMVLVPTTAGTGSEAQSFALISDAKTHMKMACGDRRLPVEGGLRPRAAILDPDLTRTQPPAVAAATAMDAITHAVETAGCRVRSDVSRAFSREAWSRLTSSVERAIRTPDDSFSRAQMLLGAHLAGCAIENAMLGAAHACANPLTARFDIAHGVAVGVLLPHVIRFNAPSGENPYSDLMASADDLAHEIERLLSIVGIPRRFSEHGVGADSLVELARQAATQWTAGFNPRSVGAAELLEIYRAAL
jgi:alcohol dehydrogenase